VPGYSTARIFPESVVAMRGRVVYISSKKGFGINEALLLWVAV